MHAAMTDSSFRAGMITETVAGEGAAVRAPSGEAICSVIGIVYWMRKRRFSAQVD